MEVEFRNITVTIADAKDPRAAYDRLCEMLGVQHPDGVTVEWQTDTFMVINEDTHERSTEELFPEA